MARKATPTRSRNKGTQRKKVRQLSWLDKLLRTLPFSEEEMQRGISWLLAGALVILAIAAANWFGLITQAYAQYSQLAARAGFEVKRVKITGNERVDQVKVYDIVLAEKKRAMPMVDVGKIRSDLLQYGWIKDAQVFRRLPDTLGVTIIERKPAALWNNEGRYSLIDAEGIVLEKSSPQKAGNLPLLSGAGANKQTVALEKLLDRAASLKTQIAGASWVGNRRWDIRFKTGETLALPEGEAAAAGALIKFARMEGVNRLLGQGLVHFDMRDPARLYIRKSPKTQSETKPVSKAVSKPSEKPADKQKPSGGMAA